MIVTSETYMQSSKVTPELLERDPENRLLARAPRYRLPSWMIRDQALAASGLLVNKPGGPPVKTYQPPGIWEEATFGTKRYTQDKGEALYRRSLYIFWRRIDEPGMPSRVEAAGARALSAGEAAPLGKDIIHSVTNPIPRLTGALHVYGGDFFRPGRSEWDPETLREGPYDAERTKAMFEAANKG